MSLATLHTDAHRRLATVRAYPAKLAGRVATGIAVHLLKLEPSVAAAIHAWHVNPNQVDTSAPDDLVDGRALPFALIGISVRRPQLLIAAIAALTALPFLILCKLL